MLSIGETLVPNSCPRKRKRVAPFPHVCVCASEEGREAELDQVIWSACTAVSIDTIHDSIFWSSHFFPFRSIHFSPFPARQLLTRNDFYGFMERFPFLLLLFPFLFLSSTWTTIILHVTLPADLASYLLSIPLQIL